MVLTTKLKPGQFEIIREGQESLMRINYEGYPKIPSIEEDPMCMAKLIDNLIEVPSVSRVVFSQRRNYSYDYENTQMLIEIAMLYNRLVKQKRALSIGAMGSPIASQQDMPRRHGLVQYVVFNLLRSDPIGAYVELRRIIREEKIKLKHITEEREIESEQIFIDLLAGVYNELGGTLLIKKTRPYIEGYSLGDRAVYATVFRPTITPDFMFTRLMAQPPLDGEEIDVYKFSNSEVVIYSLPTDIKPLYHLTPPEFKLTEDKFLLVDMARTVMAEHQPKEEEFLDPEKMRQTFFNIGKDLIMELAEHKNMDLNIDDVSELTSVLVRYTVGFGLLEVLLQDEKVQDITINSPIGETPVFINHQDFGECVTNIIPSKSDGDSWASKFRLLSGRPLDEANPILDTELLVPGARARVAIIQKPLNPFGLAYAFRRHRDEPWTLPLFIKNKMMNPLAAGLLSFIIDGARTMLFAGTRSSGKTSLLGSALIEIMRKHRILTVEDSVTGDSEVIIKRHGRFERTLIGKLIDGLIERHGRWYNLSGHEILGNNERIEIFSMNKEGKIELSRITKFIRHKTNKKIYEITTRTGRTIKVTGDHSLFGLNEEGKISEFAARDLKKKEFIAVPRKMPFNNCHIRHINLLDHLDKLNKGYLVGNPIKRFLNKYKIIVHSLGKEYNHTRTSRSMWIRNGMVPIKIIKDLKSLGYCLEDAEDVYFKYSGNSKKIPIKIELDHNLLALIGLWIADGCYDQKSIIFSVVEEENRAIVYAIANRYGFNVKFHSDTFSLMINSITLKMVMREILELKGNSYTKRIPQWVFNLSKEQISGVINGLFSGDGCVSDKEIMLSLASFGLLRDVQTLLLNFGIILRIGRYRERDHVYESRISALKSIKKFKQDIGLLVSGKSKRLDLLCQKSSTHDTTDVIPLSLTFKKRFKKLYSSFNYKDYIYGEESNFGSVKLGNLMSQIEINDGLFHDLKLLASSDLFWDQIKEIKTYSLKNEYVYDISVPENESFVANNIVAHNTLELPTEAMRRLGFNIQPMKVRSALTKGGSEVEADEGIRTSLRMGDSALIVGEIRSSIRGNEEVLILENGLTKRIQIKDLEGKDISKIHVPSMDFDLKFRLKKLKAFIKHPKRKKLLKLITKTGREVTVTQDHSLFTHKNFQIIPVECQKVRVGTKIIIPEKIPSGYSNINSINLLELLQDEDCRLVGYENDLRHLIKKIGWKKASEISNKGYDVYQYLRKGIQHTNIPIESYKLLVNEAEGNYNLGTLQIKKGTSNVLSATLEVSKELCRFLGYYVAEGYTQTTGNVVLSNSNQLIIDDIINISENLFTTVPYVRLTKGFGFSTQITLRNKVLALLVKKLGSGRTALDKRVPPIIFGLSEDKICEFLKGYFDGDGSQTSTKAGGNRIACATISKNLANDILYLLLHIGIVARVYKVQYNDNIRHDLYVVEFKQRKYIDIFMQKVGFRKYAKKLIQRGVSHSKFNTVDYDINVLEKHVQLKRHYRHLRRYSSCGKEYLKKAVSDSKYTSNRLKTFVNGEFYIDEVKEVHEINLDDGEYVYDLSVEPCQNFVGGFGGIMLHNSEALALYESMRIGALANVVAGTIHGDSPYGVFDRVVNDLKVPRTSFKATDIIIISNPILSADGLHRWRRILSITEIRKHWEDDPLREAGFVDLMKYNPLTDELEPTADLINGESEILKSIASNVRGWAGNWDAVWDNVMLRAKIKKTLVEYSAKTELPQLLEAEFVVLSNDEFHRLFEEVQSETGELDNNKIFFRWEEWLKKEIRKIKGLV